MAKNINDLIAEFDKLKLHPGLPKYSGNDVSEMEKKVECELPPDFKATMEVGYISKGTFHFLPVSRYGKDNKFVIFGKWNENIFMFDTTQNSPNFPIFQITPASLTPERCFDDFYDWLKSVLNSVSTMNFPD
ncbi:MAG: hypothetical protein KDK36_07990 [Leptospiraceae bacterium]|nr:hypothetical protein [Leptospiraceae bacterium]